MGLANSVFYYSGIPEHGCSARNITWQYIHYSGHLPYPYNNCPHISAILDWNNCREGICEPSCWPLSV